VRCHMVRAPGLEPGQH